MSAENGDIWVWGGGDKIVPTDRCGALPVLFERPASLKEHEKIVDIAFGFQHTLLWTAA